MGCMQVADFGLGARIQDSGCNVQQCSAGLGQARVRVLADKHTCHINPATTLCVNAVLQPLILIQATAIKFTSIHRVVSFACNIESMTP